MFGALLQWAQSTWRNSFVHFGLREHIGDNGRCHSVCGVFGGVCGGLCSKKLVTPSMGFPGGSRAPSPATTSTLPVVVVMLKNESIIVVFFVVILDGGIVD